LRVENPKGTDCDLAVDGSHQAVPAGTTSFHARSGSRRFVATCTVGNRVPERVFDLKFASDEVVVLDVDDLVRGGGIRVVHVPAIARLIRPSRSF
jgi:hypothetical protein